MDLRRHVREGTRFREAVGAATLPLLGGRPRNASVLQALLPSHATRVVVYLKPINMRSGPAKLREFFTEILGIEPDHSTAFLFTNKARDCLVMYVLDEDGEQTLIKKLDKGAFLLPAPDREGAECAIMKPRVLSGLFR